MQRFLHPSDEDLPFTFGGEKFKKLGAAYKQIAEKLNTGIQPAYIYKKVQ